MLRRQDFVFVGDRMTQKIVETVQFLFLPISQYLISSYTRGSLSRYNTRNTSDYFIPKNRLQFFRNRVSDVINQWNLLLIEARGTTSLNMKNHSKTFPNHRLFSCLSYNQARNRLFKELLKTKLILLTITFDFGETKHYLNP